jgi:DUF4097 and DUF4098 domain-containing protein YvlB
MGARYKLKPETRVKVLSASGETVVTAEDREDIEVEPPERHVDISNGVAEIKSKSGSTRVRVPTGTNVSVGALSGSVRLEGTFGSIKVSAVSGSVTVGRALGDVDIRSVSGNLTIESAAGECSLNSKSGRIRVGNVGRLAKAATISGSVEMGTEGIADVEIKTISGHIMLSVPEGRSPRIRFRTIAGKLRCECVQGDDFEIRAASVSGSIDIKQA